MTKATDSHRSLAVGKDPGQDQGVNLGKKARGDANGFAWAWPPRLNDPLTEKVVVGDWGCVYIRPGSGQVPSDVMIEFDAHSLDARREALAFARALVERLRLEHPSARVEFYAASDHYHVIVEDFGNFQQKLIAGLCESFENASLSDGGLLSGSRIGRSTFANERGHSISEDFLRRR